MTGPIASDTTFRLGQLADPEAFHQPIVLNGTETAWLLAGLRTMMVIRTVEEQIAEGVENGTIRCPCHLAIGQEACAVGVAAHLTPDDRAFGAHRSHGHYLALGGSVHRLLAEVLGRKTGASRGMGGSMHLVDRQHGLYGTVPIVGATIPIAVGAGLAARLDGRKAIAVSFFGDGATEEGAFHESMNLAVILKAPVLFVCENNLFSSHLHIRLRQAEDSTARYAAAHGVAWRRVDGNDLVSVAEAAGELIGQMRRDTTPGFLELVTYRWRGHVGWREDEDVGVQRKESLLAWKGRDPIRRLADAMVEGRHVDSNLLKRLQTEVKGEVDAAWKKALGDPYPEPGALLDTVHFQRDEPIGGGR